MFSFLAVVCDVHQILMPWVKSIAVFALVFLAGVFLKKYILKLFKKISHKAGFKISEDTLNISSDFVYFWFFILASYCLFLIAPVNHDSRLVHKIFGGVFSFSIVIFAANIIAVMMHKTMAETITANVIRIVVIFAGAIMILHLLGIKLTPILTALGIGSLAVALSLQDTLGNLIAGMNILANKQIKKGSYIKLDTGQEGRVIDITWRTTRIEEMSNKIITIPNLKLASSVITDYHSEISDFPVLIHCGVAYGTDLDKAEKIAVEAAKEVIERMDGTIKTALPVVRFTDFGDSAIKFVLIFRVKDMYTSDVVVHEVIKNLYKKFVDAGMEIPYPQRVMHIKNESGKL